MAKLTFTVDIPELKHSSNFIQQLQDEIDDEKRQLSITHTINNKTSKVHAKILGDIVKKLNQELKPINLSFRTDYIGLSNNYKQIQISLIINNFLYAFNIEPIVDRNFKQSKYVTYTGAYEIRRPIGYNNYRNIKNDENVVNNILNEMRDSIKEYMEKIV